MSETMWGYLFLLLGIMAAGLLILFGSINTKDEQNYYLLKEVTQNAMLDAVDDVAYEVGLTQEEVNNNTGIIKCVSGQPGTIRIITERFIESFARRYAEVAHVNKDYRIEFYEILECPAKVTVRVISTEDFSWLEKIFNATPDGESTDAKIVNELTAILETKE